MMDNAFIMTQLFVAAWRIGRERLRQQQSTLKVLYEAAKAANDALPGTPSIQLDQMSDGDYEHLRKWWEEDGMARGARDAYASAIIFFVDNLLKVTFRFYEMIPGVTKTLNKGLNGVPTHLIFRHTGNNIRHYDEWRAPTHQIPKADSAYKAVTAIATVLQRRVPAKSALSVMASNWAWPIVAAVGNGTFEGFISRVRECMDEMLGNVGMQNDELVLQELAKER